jgi:hypothetical protein
MSYTTEETWRRRAALLYGELLFWKRLCAMLGTLLLACAIVIVLQYLKLP